MTWRLTLNPSAQWPLLKYYHGPDGEKVARRFVKQLDANARYVLAEKTDNGWEERDRG